MTPRIPTLTYISVVTAALLQTACQQPDVNCTSAHGTFAARYERKSGPADQPCGQIIGDILGMSTYYAPGGVNDTPKFAEPSVAIRAMYLYEYVYNQVYAPETVFDTRKIDMEVGDPDAFGDFAAGVPDDEGFCAAPKMSKVTLDLPEVLEVEEVVDDPLTEDVDESVAPVAPQAAATLSYAWSNVKFLVTADAQGTQFSADLEFTQDACKATYHVVGVYPAIGCAGADGMPDNTVCESDVNGINPDFPTECLMFSEGVGYCVLKDEPPAYDNAA